MWFRNNDNDIEKEMNRFIELIKENDKLRKELNELYLFSLKACDEIYNHTGNSEWRDRLIEMMKK